MIAVSGLFVFLVEAETGRVWEADCGLVNCFSDTVLGMAECGLANKLDLSKVIYFVWVPWLLEGLVGRWMHFSMEKSKIDSCSGCC